MAWGLPLYSVITPSCTSASGDLNLQKATLLSPDSLAPGDRDQAEAWHTFKSLPMLGLKAKRWSWE